MTSNQTNNDFASSDEQVISRIHLVRGQKVMLDRDLAALYGVTPRRLREQMKRNIARFPNNFMFQITEQEFKLMVSQFATPTKRSLGGHFPYAFTEHGVLMLANVLRSEQAIKMSIRLIEIFIKSREMLTAHQEILLKLEKLENKVGLHDDNIRMLFRHIKELVVQKTQTPAPIGFRRNRERASE